MDKTFNLNPNIIGPNSSTSISVSANTDADVLQAIVKNDPFPTRPNGTIPLGNISLAADGNPVNFKANGGSVSFGFKASFRTGAGVFDKSDDAIGSLQLEAPSALNLDIPGGPTDRYLLMLLGYTASGTFSASHPIGVIGSLTFGATAAAGGIYAVLHRFAASEGSATVLGTTVGSWRLPRQIDAIEDLKPGTWLIAEADGSLALSLKAQMGFDFNFVRQAHLLGMTRELGAKIDAGVTATLGFSVSGKHIICLGRESDGPVYRLRLFKQKTKGISAGLNVIVGVTGRAQLPGSLDDFVKAVFGVHGEQVVRDLQLIRKWTDPNTDLSDTVARLVNKTGLDLLTDVTGIDARAEFNKARQKILDVFALWDGLPQRASSALWKILGTFGETETATFKTFLTALANPDPAASNQALAQALQKVTFGDTPEGQWLAAIAERGLLRLTDQLDEVRQVARQTLQILNGGEIKKLQAFINQRLNLNQIRNIVTRNDFDKLDGWLIARLSDFFDKKLHFEDLDEIRAAINGVFTKASEIYDKSLKALNNRYTFEFAATYEKTTEGQALIDVEFDMSQAAAAAALREVVVNGKLDNLLVNEIAGVTLNSATLTHQIKRRTDVQIHMPFFDSETEHINTSIAKMNVEHDGGRVLAYQVDAKDKVTVKNRCMSQLSVLGALRVKDGQVTVGAAEDQSIVYQQLQIKSKTTRKDIESRTAPFIRRMLNGVMTDGALDTFYAGLDETVSNVLHTPPNTFGDVAISLEVDLPASVLAAWFNKLDDDRLNNAKMDMSVRLQKDFKSLLASTYFQDLGKFDRNATPIALLLWAALPPSTSIKFVDGQIKQLDTRKTVFWNSPDIDLRRALAVHPQTTAALAASLTVASQRLSAIGDDDNAQFFSPGNIKRILEIALSPLGDNLLQPLLRTEADLVNGAADALEDVQKSLADMPTAPTKAIVRLAEFGAEITDTFNNKLSVYGKETLRPLSSMLFVGASAALNPGVLSTPKAMLNLYVLKSQHGFNLTQFLAGELPEQSDVAVAQTLTNLGV
jgi:hypothetical protein